MPYLLEQLNDGSIADKNFRALARDMNPPVPQTRVYNSANISHTTSGTRQFLTFDSERFDNGSLHSTSANTGRLTFPITGLYMVGAHIVFASNSTGIREVSIRLNGATFIVLDNRMAVNGDDTEIALATIYQFAAGDYVEVGANQTSGGALNIRAVSNFGPEFYAVRLGGYVNVGV